MKISKKKSRKGKKILNQSAKKRGKKIETNTLIVIERTHHTIVSFSFSCPKRVHHNRIYKVYVFSLRIAQKKVDDSYLSIKSCCFGKHNIRHNKDNQMWRKTTTKNCISEIMKLESENIYNCDWWNCDETKGKKKGERDSVRECVCVRETMN